MGIQQQRHGTVIELTLDWPEVRNAIAVDEAREFRAALAEAFADEAASALVLTANGKAFCSGGNLPKLLEHIGDGGEETVRTTIYGEFQAIARLLANAPIPIIAAVDGPAVGFGCDLALAGSMTFIGENGWLAQGWARAGLIPAVGGTLYVSRRGGPQAVWRLLTAERVDGPTAEAWGLGIACTNAREAALEAAAKLASLSNKPLRALTELSKITEVEAHLARALDHQVGFLTGEEFAAFAKAMLKG